jgi:diadenosine tetraphosphate (Ap4A) HIT family hydrolase
MPTPDPLTLDCAFCAIVRGDAPATFVHQDDLVVAFMDIRPVQPGHVLVVPRAHAKLIPEFDDSILTRLLSVATDLNRAVLKTMADRIRPRTTPTEATEPRVR